MNSGDKKRTDFSSFFVVVVVNTVIVYYNFRNIISNCWYYIGIGIGIGKGKSNDFQVNGWDEWKNRCNKNAVKGVKREPLISKQNPVE